MTDNRSPVSDALAGRLDDEHKRELKHSSVERNIVDYALIHGMTGHSRALNIGT